MGRLKGKVILVAGSGVIGEGLALRYAAEGAQVVLGDLNSAAAETVVEKIHQNGGEATAIHLDGADEKSVDAAIATCIKTYGGLDGLHVNFADLSDNSRERGILELPLDVYDKTQQVNVRGYYLCTRAALPALIERGGGAIVYTSSVAAHAGGDAQVAYAMSKAAGQALMRHVASRYGKDGVRANSIAPGLTLNEKLETELPTELLDWCRDRAAIKSRNSGRPDDIASVGTLLLSDEGGYITGQIICVDGGTTMRP